MKSVMIFFAQSLTAEVHGIIDGMSIRGYSKWENVSGRGSVKGEPHLGSHAWPAMNSSIMCVIDDSKVKPLFDKLRDLDSQTEMQGIRAYSWNIEDSL